MASAASASSDIHFHVRLGSDSRSLALPATQFAAADAQAFQALLALIEATFALQKNSFRLSYFDEEHEKISVTCWNDFKVAVDEHSVMKKAVQLYVEQGDEEVDEEDLVFINNSPNVLTKQVDAQAQTPSVDRVDALTQTTAAKDGGDEKSAESAAMQATAVNPVTAANTSFWWRLFGKGAAASASASRSPEPVNVNVHGAPIDELDGKASAPVDAVASPALSISEAVSEASDGVGSVVDAPPTLSLLLLSDLSELLTALRAETVTQLDSANAEQLSATTHSKVRFQRTKQIFAEELREALADIRKRANRAAAPAVAAAASVVNAPQVAVSPVKAPEVVAVQPAKKAEVQDAFAAIEEEEKNGNAHAAKSTSSASASYAAVVTASLASSSSAAAASSSSSASSESKSASSSSPAFSMSDESVAQVVDMCSRMGFKADVAKIRFLMTKSNGDYDTLIDWLITDSVVKFAVPKAT